MFDNAVENADEMMPVVGTASGSTLTAASCASSRDACSATLAELGNVGPLKKGDSVQVVVNNCFVDAVVVGPSTPSAAESPTPDASSGAALPKQQPTTWNVLVFEEELDQWKEYSAGCTRACTFPRSALYNTHGSVVQHTLPPRCFQAGSAGAEHAMKRVAADPTDPGYALILLGFGEANLDAFAEILHAVCTTATAEMATEDEIGACHVGPIKTMGGAARKAKDKFDGAYDKVDDIIRGTIPCKTFVGIVALVVAVFAHAGITVIRFKDRLHRAYDAANGYRDILITVRMIESGMLAEVQFTLQELLAIKNSGAHDAYEAIRDVAAGTELHGALTDSALSKIRSGLVTEVDIRGSMIPIAIGDGDGGGGGDAAVDGAAVATDSVTADASDNTAGAATNTTTSGTQGAVGKSDTQNTDAGLLEGAALPLNAPDKNSGGTDQQPVAAPAKLPADEIFLEMMDADIAAAAVDAADGKKSVVVTQSVVVPAAPLSDEVALPQPAGDADASANPEPHDGSTTDAAAGCEPAAVGTAADARAVAELATVVDALQSKIVPALASTTCHLKVLAMDAVPNMKGVPLGCILTRAVLAQLAPFIEVLGLSSTGVVGNVPAMLWTSCTNLTTVRLNNNPALVGDATGGAGAAGVAACSRLKILQFECCRELDTTELFNGVLSGAASTIEEMWLNSTKLTGDLPPSIGKCGALRRLNLAKTGLTGSIPAEISGCVSLETLYLSNTEISGAIPAELWTNCVSLEIFFAAETRVSGSLLPEVGKCARLQKLSMRSTLLSGVVPNEIGNCAALLELYLNECQLTGELPVAALARCQKLTTLKLFGNAFDSSSADIDPASTLKAALPNLVKLEL